MGFQPCSHSFVCLVVRSTRHTLAGASPPLPTPIPTLAFWVNSRANNQPIRWVSQLKTSCSILALEEQLLRHLTETETEHHPRRGSLTEGLKGQQANLQRHPKCPPPNTIHLRLLLSPKPPTLSPQDLPLRKRTWHHIPKDRPFPRLIPTLPCSTLAQHLPSRQTLW